MTTAAIILAIIAAIAAAAILATRIERARLTRIHAEEMARADAIRAHVRRAVVDRFRDLFPSYITEPEIVSQWDAEIRQASALPGGEKVAAWWPGPAQVHIIDRPHHVVTYVTDGGDLRNMKLYLRDRVADLRPVHYRAGDALKLARRLAAPTTGEAA